MANNSSQGRRNYIYGNAVTKEEIKRGVEGAPSYEPLRVLKGENKRNRHMSMSFPYAVFLAAAIFVMGIALVNYLKLQSEITKLVEDIAISESTLNNLTLANDDEYSKIITAIDYDEIRRVAIEELGMVYASNDQIISYTRENSDYVRQLVDLPNE